MYYIVLSFAVMCAPLLSAVGMLGQKGADDTPSTRRLAFPAEFPSEGHRAVIEGAEHALLLNPVEGQAFRCGAKRQRSASQLERDTRKQRSTTALDCGVSSQRSTPALHLTFTFDDGRTVPASGPSILHCPSTLQSVPEDEGSSSGELVSFARQIEQFEETPSAFDVPRSLTTRGVPVVIYCGDGGGIRGYIPVSVSASLEALVGLPIAHMVDIVVGTSTSGIWALGLSVPDENGNPRFSAHALKRIYAERGNEIFVPRRANLGGFRNSKYTSAIEEVLESYFGEHTLADCLIPTVVTSFDLERRKPKIFKSVSAQQDPHKNFFMRDVARATSAAPTYFPPAEIYSMPDVHGEKLRIVAVDGGLAVNNPTACGFAEALRMYPDASEYLLISLGTGRATVPMYFDDVKDMGKIGWASRLPELMIDGPADITHYVMASVSQTFSGRVRYFRLQTELQAENAAMDDISPRNLTVLANRAETLVETPQFQEVARLLRSLPDVRVRHEMRQQGRGS